MPSQKLIYLASPYSHPESEIREGRFKAVCAKSAQLMNQGYFIFSPIAHTHPIAMSGDLPLGFDYWQQYDETILSRCDELWIYCLSGWQHSVGVKAEIEIAERRGIPVKYIA